jgi:excisionase family DNA binding protein
MGHLEALDARGPLLLTVVQAGALLGLGRTKTYELIAGGQLEAVHIGRAARVPLASVHRYVEALSHPVPTIRRAPSRRRLSQPSLPFIDLTKD